MKLSDYMELFIAKEINSNELLLLYHYYKHGFCPDEKGAKIFLKMPKSNYYKAKRGIIDKFGEEIFDPNYKFGGKNTKKLP